MRHSVPRLLLSDLPQVFLSYRPQQLLICWTVQYEKHLATSDEEPSFETFQQYALRSFSWPSGRPFPAPCMQAPGLKLSTVQAGQKALWR